MEMIKKAKKAIALSIGALLCVAAAGCGAAKAPKAISLASEGYIFSEAGETYNIAGDVQTEGENASVEFKYSSSDTSVAEISEDGVLTVKGEGSATVTVASAEDESVSASAAVLVYDYAGVYTCEKYIDAMGCDVKVSLSVADDGTFGFYRYPMNVNLEGGGQMEGLQDAGTYEVKGNEMKFSADYLGTFNLTFTLDKDGNAQLSGDTPTGGASTDMTFSRTVSEDRGESGTYTGSGETMSGNSVSYSLQLNSGTYVLTAAGADGAETTVSSGVYSFAGEEIEFFAEEGTTFSASYDESRQVIEGTAIPVSAENSYEFTAVTLTKGQ